MNESKVDRRIKFRAWNAKKNKMFDHENISIGLKNTKNSDTWQYMQFIGLTDKHGREIYEGDIMEIGNSKRRCVVVFFGEQPSYRLEYIKAEMLIGGRPDTDFDPIPISQHHHQFEVVGNLYEGILQ